MTNKEYTNSQIAAVIDEYIHKDICRKILKRKFIDGKTYENIAEEFDLSTRHVQRIIYKYEMTVFKHL